MYALNYSWVWARDMEWSPALSIGGGFGGRGGWEVGCRGWRFGGAKHWGEGRTTAWALSRNLPKPVSRSLPEAIKTQEKTTGEVSTTLFTTFRRKSENYFQSNSHTPVLKAKWYCILSFIAWMWMELVEGLNIKAIDWSNDCKPIAKNQNICFNNFISH